MTAILPVVLAGGSGTRLWPLSREHYPKQFLALTSGRTMMQEALRRIAPLDGALPPCIVCNEAHRFLAAEQCREAGQPWSAIVLESAPRNTAPAATLAACHALAAGEDPVLLVAPSDAYIEDPVRFRQAVVAGLGPAAQGRLVTFGIRPSSPETGYGYLRVGEKLPQGRAHRVAQFVEKPDRSTAERFVASGEYLWNSGICLFLASAWTAAVERHAPAVLECCQAAVATGSADLDFFRPGPAFARSPSVSIEYAVMEKTAEAVVVSLDTGWSDLGSWTALHTVSEADGDNNTLAGDVIAVGATDSLVHATSRLVAAVGVERLIIAETADAVLVAARDEAQRVREVVDRLQALSRPEHRVHRRARRPWGSFESVEIGDGYKVKRIIVDPGARLSLQMHRRRSEHWVVVRGTAEVTCDDSTLTLCANQSTYIPCGSRHRLGNPGDVPLHLIEVQVGDYLEEDDVVRFADDFGREVAR